MGKSIARAALIAMAIAAGAGNARARMMPMGIPLPTTIVIFKPPPEEPFGDRPTVTMGVGGKSFKFVLKDAWVDDPAGKVHWPDVWEQVRQHQPNFKVTGIGSDVFEKVEPGQALTLRGVYGPLNYNFEVIGTDFGGGPFPAPQHY